MKKYVNITLMAIVFLSISCARKSEVQENVIVVSNQPLKLIIQELTKNAINVDCITRPGDSPHTYSPRPSDAEKVENARIFFYTAENLDAWAAKFNSKRKIEVIKLLPSEYVNYFKLGHQCDDHCSGSEHHVNSIATLDPHFWLDPLAVKALIPLIEKEIIKAFPEQKENIEKNAEQFAKELEILNESIGKELAGKRGRALLSFHPSFEYYIKRYNLYSAGSIEVAPGKEPSPEYIRELSFKIKALRINAIFSEPQLSEKSAKSIAEMTGSKLKILDPLGGGKDMNTYTDLLLKNTLILKENL